MNEAAIRGCTSVRNWIPPFARLTAPPCAAVRAPQTRRPGSSADGGPALVVLELTPTLTGDPGRFLDVAPVARRVCRGSRHTGAPLIDTTSCAFSDECRCLTPERERRASRQLRGPGRRRDRGRSMQSHCALRMIRRRAQLATGQPPADSRFRRPTPASSRSRWRPFATSVGIGASCHGVGLLAPALLLHQERGHEVRADRGLRKGRKRGVSRRPRQAGAEAAPFRPEGQPGERPRGLAQPQAKQARCPRQ